MEVITSGVEDVKKPRFEFRSFGQNFDHASRRMARLSVPVEERFWERFSDEIYIVSVNDDDNNIKIRDKKIERKTRGAIVDGLEQWIPVWSGDFPIEVRVLEEQLFLPLKVSPPSFPYNTCNEKELINIINEHPQLQAVYVSKRRSGYNVNNTICETGIILVNGACVFTINTESSEIENVKKTIRDIGLSEEENINYVQAIKRIIGMTAHQQEN